MDQEKFIKLHEANCKIRHSEIGEVFRILELLRTLNNLRRNEGVDDYEFLSLKDFIIRKVDPVYKIQKHEVEEQILDLYEKSKAEGHDFLKTDEWIKKTGSGKTQPSNLGVVGGVVEKDTILDGEITNQPVKKFKDDFNRINNGDLPEASYY